MSTINFFEKRSKALSCMALGVFEINSMTKPRFKRAFAAAMK
jgi:hypothetical protein